MKLYILRHGITDWNVARKLQGNSNTSLNEDGRKMVEQTARGLKDVKFDYIFSSPLDRAYETASIIGRGRNIPIEKDDRLIEVGFGIDEGVEIENRTPGCKLFFEDPANYVPAKGAESFESLLKRTAEFIDEIIVPLSIKEPDANVLISGHGAMNHGLILHLLHRDLSQFWDGVWSKNCSITLFEITGNEFILLEDGLIFY